MRLPKIIQRIADASSNDIGRLGIASPSGITKPKKNRADKLRALAGAFTAETKIQRPVDYFSMKYDAHEQIGQGKNGVIVHRCTYKATGETYAVKCVPKEQIGVGVGDERPLIAILGDSPHLIRTHEVLESTDYLCYVLEHAAGGDLFDFVSKHGPLNESSARPLFLGLLYAMQEVHRTGQIHRDIKLENILVMTPNPSAPSDVRLADFEFCASNPAVGPVGSIAYSAPEALDTSDTYRSGYSQSVDLWAAGVVLYAMLSASAPFDCPLSPEATAHRIREACPGMEFSEPIWKDISLSARDLVNGLLHPNPKLRLTLQAAMHHPWITGAVGSPADAPPARAKFAMRCTWHNDAKRWSSMNVDAPMVMNQGEVQMFVDRTDSFVPLFACPMEWNPCAVTRPRAMSI